MRYAAADRSAAALWPAAPFAPFGQSVAGFSPAPVAHRTRSGIAGSPFGQPCPVSDATPARWQCPRAAVRTRVRTHKNVCAWNSPYLLRFCPSLLLIETDILWQRSVPGYRAIVHLPFGTVQDRYISPSISLIRFSRMPVMQRMRLR